MESNLDCMGDWDINGYVNVGNTLKSILKSSSPTKKIIEDDQLMTWSTISSFILYTICNVMVIFLTTCYFFNVEWI